MWGQLKEQLIDYISYSKLNDDDVIELYEEIIKDLQSDIKAIKGVK